MEEHLGYEKSVRSDNDDSRNGYKSKTIKSSIGEVKIEIPQDRKSSFEPQVVKKGRKDISDIDHINVCKGKDNPSDLCPPSHRRHARL